MAIRRGVSRRFFWSRWPNSRLLELRMCDLGVTLEGTWLEECVEQLYSELESRGIRFRPHVWLSDEWFSPAGVPGVAIPFYLTHRNLMRLERAQMLEVEGGTKTQCMMILRHEAGHALQHAFQVQRKKRWQRQFGASSTRYPDVYRPRPASRQHVQHLAFWYAQSHPDEDFAETFAVWLSSREGWRRRYRGWPALRKLECVDELMSEVAGSRPEVTTRARPHSLRQLRQTLAEHYAQRRSLFDMKFPATYDRDLTRLFSKDPRHRHHEAASAFIRRNRKELREQVARWTGEYQFTLDAVLSDMIGRCRELKLRAVGPERRLKTDFAVLLTVKTMHFLYSQGRRTWISL
jgi:hypothetical protein